VSCRTEVDVVPASARDLSQFLRALAARHGERTAVSGEGEALGFAALDQAADRWATRLAGVGFGKGSRVALLAGNGPCWLAAAFGVWRAGATLVPISTFVTAHELAEVLTHAEADLLLLQPRLRSRDHLALLGPAAARRCEILLLDDSKASTEDRGRVPFAGEPVDSESDACILYTSGTTGRPKGVRLSHRAVLATVGPTKERSGLDASDSLLSSLPLFWVAGLVIRALPTLAAGCSLHLLETFTVEAALGALRRLQPTALHLRPPQVGQIIAHPEFEPGLLRNVRKGNGRVEWFGPHLDPLRVRFITGYGMTEMAGYVTALDWREAQGGRDHLGRALPGVELRIVGTDGMPCPTGEVGEIRVRGPAIFSGYQKEPEGTGLDGEGFFATGDLGRMSETARFQFVGRTKDLLRVKGINVSPVEVENVLAAHPEVESVYVVGLPHDGMEQRVVALVVGRRRRAGLESELRALATEKLSHYKRPQEYLAVDRTEIPLSGTAKPRRDALALLAEERLRVSGAGALGGGRTLPP
jgi:acyl-CoA synthetase (AMP-forming)/AMP-acid ligase II